MNRLDRHVLVARLDNAGDVLLTGPAVRAVAARASRVTYVAGPGGAEAARLLPGVTDVVVFNAPWTGYEPPPTVERDIAAFVKQVTARAPERAIIFTSSHQSPLPLALLLRLAGVPWIAAISRDYPGSLLDLRLPSPGDVHEVERGLLLATAAGYPRPGDDDGRLEIVPAAGPSCPADSLDDSLDDAFVVVHPGASVPTRGVPPALACELVQLLRERGRRVVLTASVAERSLASRVASDADLPADALRVTRTLRDLACVLAGAEAVVCGNTGPAHLSAAVGTPVASVFAPVVPAARWHPWGVPYVLVGDQTIECAGCRARSCPIAGQPCLAPATATALADAVDTLACESVRAACP